MATTFDTPLLVLSPTAITLTGLPNRNLLRQQMDDILLRTRRSAEKLQSLVARIVEEGGKVHPFGSDARDEAQVEALLGVDAERAPRQSDPPARRSVGGI